MSSKECEPLLEKYCDQAGVPAEASALTTFYKKQLTATAAAMDAAFPNNTDLRFEDGRPVLTRRKDPERRPSRWR